MVKKHFRKQNNRGKTAATRREVRGDGGTEKIETPGKKGGANVITGKNTNKPPTRQEEKHGKLKTEKNFFSYQ